MRTIIYKDRNAICEIKHEGKRVFSISGCEKDKIAESLRNKKGTDYIWKDLVEIIDTEAGYAIETFSSN